MKVIALRVTEQELFDLIMAVYAGSNLFPSSEGEGDSAQRRQDLLEKLHGAFDAQAAVR